MGKINVYLPDDMEQAMRDRGCSPSELLQGTIRRLIAEEGRQKALEEWLAEGDAETGPPTPGDIAWADKVLAPYYERIGEPRAAS